MEFMDVHPAIAPLGVGFLVEISAIKNLSMSQSILDFWKWKDIYFYQKPWVFKQSKSENIPKLEVCRVATAWEELVRETGIDLRFHQAPCGFGGLS
jgi:hypothetical protein